MKLTRSGLLSLLRYGIVGVSLNIFGYLLYLSATWLGLEPKLAVSIFYPLGVLYGYFAHKKISFRHEGSLMDAWMMARYFTVYFIGYLISVGLLYLLHDMMGYPHQAVQAANIFILAGFLFFALKWFVFRKKACAVTTSTNETTL